MQLTLSHCRLYAHCRVAYIVKRTAVYGGGLDGVCGCDLQRQCYRVKVREATACAPTRPPSGAGANLEGRAIAQPAGDAIPSIFSTDTGEWSSELHPMPYMDGLQRDPCTNLFQRRVGPGLILIDIPSPCSTLLQLIICQAFPMIFV